MILLHRNRILRQSATVRKLVAETAVTVNDLVVPLFITEGKQVKEPIPSMPGYYRLGLDEAVKEARELSSLGLHTFLLFIKCAPALKDRTGSEALNPGGLMQQSIKAIKDALPHSCVMTDIALDPYSSDGHDGILENGIILNDATVEVLAQMSVSHAMAGADFVAPSDMMDGRIRAIRLALEENNFHHTGILSYSAKYASCFYGPFRDALDSAPGYGDKKTYQMDYSNRTEALRETIADVEEGADMVMVKPALSYLDIIREVKNTVRVPVAAYQVSGEYAMIKAAAANGWVHEDHAVLETITSIKRAGADIIATYFARQIAQLVNH